MVGDDGARWNNFFADRSRPIPFFTDQPDESLAGWLSDERLAPGRVLELGCGHGRNALYLARQGAAVDAVDLSAEALGWARQRAEAAGAAVSFQNCSIFDAAIEPESYDLVYDSGCLHHLPPHRRQSYVSLVNRALKPGGHFGLSCFRPEGGSGFTDREVYERAAWAAVSATPRSSCAPSGTAPRSRCASCARCARPPTRARFSARTSCGSCWPSKIIINGPSGRLLSFTPRSGAPAGDR